MLRSLLGKRRGKRREGGQVLVLFELCLIVMLLFVAMVIDLGFLRNNRQILVNTVDAAALAGGSMLPVVGVNGDKGSTTPQGKLEALIATTIKADYPTTLSKSDLPGPDAYTITYKCLIGVDGDGKPRTSDVPTACNPVSAGSAGATFTGAGLTRVSACDPSLGDTCNAVVVEANSTTQYAFAPVGGVNSGSSGTVSSASCKGLCGAPPVDKVDVVIITDRTLSMTTDDVKNVQLGAKTVLSTYDPALQRVALGTIGPSQVTDPTTTGITPATAGCPTSSSGYADNNAIGSVLAVGQNYDPTNAWSGTDVNYFGNAPTDSKDLGRWIPVGFTGTDTDTVHPVTDGHGFKGSYSNLVGSVRTVDNTSEIAKAISCEVPFSWGTNLDTPIRMAAYYLNTYGRIGVKKGIILETDGAPYGGDGSGHYTCDQANAAATAAKAPGSDIIIYTIGYGMDSTGTGQGKNCPTTVTVGSQYSSNVNSNEASAWTGPGQTRKSGKDLLRSMASDFSKFYDAPASDKVADAFKEAALDLIGGGAHLIQLYPAPVVTSASGTTIGGKYFTGLTSVTFDGAGATCTPTSTATSDTSITCSFIPTRPTGTKVNVVVTTPFGTSSPYPYTY